MLFRCHRLLFHQCYKFVQRTQTLIVVRYINKNVSYARNRFGWMKEHSPRFGISGSSVTVLDGPQDFYNVLMTGIGNAKNRVVLASLYIGEGPLEKAMFDGLLSRCLESMSFDSPLKVQVLLDYTRGSRGVKNSRTILLPLLQQHTGMASVALYHTPNLRGILRALIPDRYNEVIGLSHLKVYLFDDSLVMSGANLSNDYFTNRQDRYILFEDVPEISNFFAQLVSTICTFCLQLKADNSISLHPSFQIHPFKDDINTFKTEASKLVKSVIDPVQNNDGDQPQEIFKNDNFSETITEKIKNLSKSLPSNHSAITRSFSTLSENNQILEITREPLACSKDSSTEYYKANVISKHNSELQLLELLENSLIVDEQICRNSHQPAERNFEVCNKKLKADEGHLFPVINKDFKKCKSSTTFYIEKYNTFCHKFNYNNECNVKSDSLNSRKLTIDSKKNQKFDQHLRISKNTDDQPIFDQNANNHHTGGEIAGSQNADKHDTGGEIAGGQNADKHDTGGEISGGQNADKHLTGGEIAGGQIANDHVTVEQSQETGGEIDTWIYPLIQMGPLGITVDQEVTEKLLQTSGKDTTCVLASGYFNLVEGYLDLITNSSAKYNILMASPQVNGFYKAKGFAGYIPDAYTFIARKFYNRMKDTGQLERVKLFEYHQPAWTFHAKGLWLCINGDKLPSVTLIGSPNFGYRSVHRDLETQVALVTENHSLQQQLHKEYIRLFDQSKPVSEDTFDEPDRKEPLWVRLIVPIIKNFF